MTQQSIDPDDILNVGRITEFVASVQGAAAERKYASARLDVSARKGNPAGDALHGLSKAAKKR